MHGDSKAFVSAVFLRDSVQKLQLLLLLEILHDLAVPHNENSEGISCSGSFRIFSILRLPICIIV